MTVLCYKTELPWIVMAAESNLVESLAVAEPVPLRGDDDGIIWIGTTRVTLLPP